MTQIELVSNGLWWWGFYAGAIPAEQVTNEWLDTLMEACG